MRFITLTLAVIAAASIAPLTHAQNTDFGGRSEASRQRNRLDYGNSASDFKDNIMRRDRSVNNGFGVARTGPPDNDPRPAPITPPTSRAASFGVGNAGTTAKPFSAIDPTPTVSPYLALFNETGFDNDDFTYQTIVRPQIRQRAFNDQVVRQAQAINQRLTALSARNAFNTGGNENVMPTGHAATFQNYSRFYPAKAQRRGR